MGPLTLCGTLFPGLNNECAGLPLVLKATIISLGLTITHALGFGDRAEEIHGDEFVSPGFMYVQRCLHVDVCLQVFILKKRVEQIIPRGLEVDVIM